MEAILLKYLPKKSVPIVLEILEQYDVQFKVVNRRSSKHGDYKKVDGQHYISINASVNSYRMLITLIHELSHLLAFDKYGFDIKPHGKEWKQTFSGMMMPLLENTNIFPYSLLPVLRNYFRNPKASSDTDYKLTNALRAYDGGQSKSAINELPDQGRFRLHNGRIFIKGNQRVKRFECLEERTGKVYLFNPNVLVESIDVLEKES